MENEIKKKRGGKPKRLEAQKKTMKYEPKAYEGREKRKEAQIRRWKKNQRKRAELGSPETTKGSKSPRHIAQLRQEDSSKENTKKTQETKGKYVFLRYQRSSKKNEKA